MYKSSLYDVFLLAAASCSYVLYDITGHSEHENKRKNLGKVSVEPLFFPFCAKLVELA